MAPRTPPPDRFDALLGAARAVFSSRGLAQAQMADVAKAMGVAKGTLYLYVESKEALFGAVVDHLAAGGGAVPIPESLPIPTPAKGDLLRRVAAAVREKTRTPLLEAALAALPTGPTDAAAVRDEVNAVVRELADLLRASQDEIRLVDRCALDVPELAGVWYVEGRVKIVDRLAAYLAARAANGLIPAVADSRVQARIVLETLVMWTVHRLGDPMPQELDENDAHEMLIDFAMRGVLGAARSTP
jgi:AcrR family transcriptional regulator